MRLATKVPSSLKQLPSSTATLGLMATLVLAECGGSTPSTVDCAQGADCLVGQVCEAGKCVNAPPDAGPPPPCEPVDCDDANPCTLDTCAAGTCTHAAQPSTTACDDGDACTREDHCVEGACAGDAIANLEPCDGQPGYCGPTGCLECQVASHCAERDGNPCTVPSCAEGGFCTELAGNEGGACTDDNPCTLSDRCASGACVGDPKDCSIPPGQCFAPGTCNLSTGACEHPIHAGYDCNDGNNCTTGDKCNQAGVCSGGRAPGWKLVASIDYWQSDPDGSWAATQIAGPFQASGDYSHVRLTGSTDDGGYCYGYWGSGNIWSYRMSPGSGIYNVDGRYYSMGCPTNPPSFDYWGTAKLCQGNYGAGALTTVERTTAELGLYNGATVWLQGRHTIGTGSDRVACYLELYCP